MKIIMLDLYNYTVPFDSYTATINKGKRGIGNEAPSKYNSCFPVVIMSRARALAVKDPEDHLHAKLLFNPGREASSL